MFWEVLKDLDVWVLTHPVVEEDGSDWTVDPTCEECQVGSGGGGWWRREKILGDVSAVEVDFGETDVFLRVESF